MVTETARQLFVDQNVPGWLAGRRYGVPAEMVALASDRRLAGDWRGACAAARYDVRFTLDEVRDQHGAEVASALEQDLLHLVPDLLRWHAPRHARSGTGLLSPSVRIQLADYADGVSLWVLTPAHFERPQRIELRVGPLSEGDRRYEDWRRARHLWDARATPGLLATLGAGDRPPFFERDGGTRAEPDSLVERIITLQDAGELVTAWELGGIPLRAAEGGTLAPSRMPSALAAVVPAVAEAARAVLRPESPTAVLSTADTYYDFLTISLIDDKLIARAEYRNVRDVPALPRVAWQRLTDVELLRTGHLTAAELHPLVRAALFPEQPDPGFQPRLPTVDPSEARVRCGGEWHRVAWRAARATAVNHAPEEIAREHVLRGLGGAVVPCVAVTDTWRGTTAGPVPNRLRRVRHHALTALAHGLSPALDRLLDTGIDPAGLRDRWNRGLLHQLAKLDDGVRLLPRLLAAGLDINARDAKGRTPLLTVLFDGAGAELVRAMLDAGAEPLVVDGMADGALHLLRSRDASAIVGWLVASGIDLDRVDEYGRTPLMAQIIADAPAEAIRATYEAGADPAQGADWYGYRVADLVDVHKRTDLGFLPPTPRGNP